MKKFFAILFILIFLVSTGVALAKDSSGSFTYEEIVKDYNLPYPGLLPDNRFYFLKMIRDKMTSILISDPLKKAEFDILQADKRLSTGIFLLLPNEKKYDLAISAISKGENYLFDAVSKTRQAKQQGIRITETKNRLSDSLVKHQQILKRLETVFSGDVKKQLSEQEQRIKDMQKTVSNKELL